MKILKALLILVAAGQLAIPATMILQRERTLRDGHVYKFRTRPVDPYDAFRGRYVQLGFEQDHAPLTGENISNGATGYARLETDAEGFAIVRAVTPEPPEQGDFLKVRVIYAAWNNKAGEAHFRMPFDRFYLEETKAPAAERAYREHSRQGGARDAYVIVRVRAGQGVIENLYVAGQPIAEYAKGR
jgi:uncharacterized membrane-anchored protein